MDKVRYGFIVRNRFEYWNLCTAFVVGQIELDIHRHTLDYMCHTARFHDHVPSSEEGCHDVAGVAASDVLQHVEEPPSFVGADLLVELLVHIFQSEVGGDVQQAALGCQ